MSENIQNIQTIILTKVGTVRNAEVQQERSALWDSREMKCDNHQNTVCSPQGKLLLLEHQQPVGHLAYLVPLSTHSKIPLL